MKKRFSRDRDFWLWFIGTAVITTLIFAWELGIFRNFLPSPLRPSATATEWGFTALLITILSLNVGLLRFRSKHGTCPVGAKRATKIGGVISVITLLCPVCLLVPVTLLGISISLTFLAPFLPLLRLITLLLLGLATIMLWPTMHR